MKKKVILSFDYELFFGERSGTVEKSIIIPTRRILETMDRYKMKGNFFIDYLMFVRLECNDDERSRSDLNLLKHQVKDIVRRGHRIELHMHPHWLDAKYNGDGTWDYSDYSHYMLSSLSDDEICQLFIKGVEYFHRLVHDIDPSYRICAFRAGGWAIQPFEKLKSAFRAANIKIDSSAAHGIYNLQEDQRYDFRHMPDKAFYRFEDDVCIENGSGQFLEIPITSFHRGVGYMLIDKLFRIFHVLDRQTDGSHQRKAGVSNFKIRKSDKLSSDFKSMFTLSGVSCVSALCSLFFHKKQYCYCYIDHPKDFTSSTLHGLKVLGLLSETILYKEFIAETD